jgi:hypothetical protein
MLWDGRRAIRFLPSVGHAAWATRSRSQCERQFRQAADHDIDGDSR